MLWWIAVCGVYGASFLRLRHALAWFRADTRTELPSRVDRTVVRVVILVISPLLAAASVWHTVRDWLHHQQVRRALRHLPPADAEQRHVVDEMQHPDFYAAAHHPAGNLRGASE